MSALPRPAGSADRGAAAVELAMLLPLVMLILFGAIEFGRAFTYQLSMTSGARDAARVMAVQNDWPTAEATALLAMPAVVAAPVTLLSPPLITPSTTSCTPGTTVTVTVTSAYQFPLLPLGPRTLRGIGAMRCGG